jgi:phage shock protein C
MEKRLYRSSKDRMLFGVCGGLGQYFNIDPVIVRVIFVITIFFGGLGIIAYIIMAIVVPNENSKAAEPKDTLKENVHEIKDTTESIGKDIQKTFSSKDDIDKNISKIKKRLFFIVLF